jgi:predicted small lipoprotein YifL
MRLLTSLSLLFVLTACGTRGPLELPPGPPPKPLLGGTPAQTKQVPQTPPDNSNIHIQQ